MTTADNDTNQNEEEALMEGGGKPADETTSATKNSTHIKRLRSQSSSGMDSSVLRFENVTFSVGSGEKEKTILQGITSTVKWGHVLAVMGPSGAGKTVLISALTMDATFGKSVGKVTLNNVPITNHIFKRHCYVVKQLDKHWPYLTCRETLVYAAELYDVADKEHIGAIVDEVISKMGLNVCEDTRCARLSGGQRRRLSLGIALLKQPTLLFLDEPTSGLDAAAASNIMQEILRVAKEERIIILCTIHQPSTRVYNGFDQVMILSKGREAFTGNVQDAIPYFADKGYPCPEATNPAEFFLDLVNADFSDQKTVDHILDQWEESRPENLASMHGKHGLAGGDGTDGVEEGYQTGLDKQIWIMFNRHSTLIIRDPILYIGRSAIFLISNLIFAIVYWNARDFKQSQATNKFWVNIWFIAVTSNMGVVAVYALNDEFKSILREAKNGMVTSSAYVLAKSIMVIPILFIFGVFALGIPSYAVQNSEPSTFGMSLVLFATIMFVFESVAETLSVWFEDPILGMLQFMNFWFGSFLFGGFLIPLDDLVWPFKLFYYIFPYSYYMRSTMYTLFVDATFEPCTDPTTSAVCTPSTDGGDVLAEMSRVFPLVGNEDTVAQDIGIMLAIAAVYKIIYIMGVIYKTSTSSKFVLE